MKNRLSVFCLYTNDLFITFILDVRTSIVLLLITHILPTISIRKGKQSARWRPSRLEVAEGFWLQLKVYNLQLHHNFFQSFKGNLLHSII